VKNPERRKMNLYRLFEAGICRALDGERVAIYQGINGFFLGEWYGEDTSAPNTTTIAVFDPQSWRFQDWVEKNTLDYVEGEKDINIPIMAFEAYWEFECRGLHF